MKKFLVSLLIISILTISCVSSMASPQTHTGVYVDGMQFYLEKEPINYNNRLYLQADVLCGLLGISYVYNPSTASITVISGTDFLSSKLNSNVVVKNTMPLVDVDGFAVILDGVIMFSIRNVAKCIGKYVEWNDTEKAIYIFSQKPISNDYLNNESNTPKVYPDCNIPDFGTFSKTDCDYSESTTELDGSTTHTYKYIVSRYNMYASGVVQNYLNELINLGWITDGKQYEIPEENMMYYYFEKDNCHMAVSLVRDANENIYTLWVTYTIY